MGQSEEKRSTGKRKDEGKKIKRPAAKPEGDDNTGKRKLKKFRKDAVKGKRMNKDVFRKLRQMLMEELDLSRELSDKEILVVID